VPRPELHAAGGALLAELAGCAPVSVMKAKEAIQRGVDLELDDGLAVERECYDVTLYTDDRNEGLAAFAEKRPPKFTGK
jgi:methylglutaconyl-CoA hydratase